MGQNLHVGTHKNGHPNYDKMTWFRDWFRSFKALAEEIDFPVSEDDAGYREHHREGLTPAEALQSELDCLENKRG